MRIKRDYSKRNYDCNIEDWLIDVATFHPEDKVANRAMKILRTRYSKGYHFCWEMDELALNKYADEWKYICNCNVD
jgi:hypothetical protein